MSEKKELPKDSKETKSQNPSGASMVFVSHDTRDAEIAEAFSKLLGSVSAGVLKSFRSSDKRGKQGIEYGVEWYPEIMGKLEDASDVVCLLTPYSVGRPWILYEAGVAKGKLDTPVHGLALGVPLSDASTGPFAQFQNCDDDEDSITSLVMQLVGRIPNAEPDRDIVEMQVQSFKKKVSEILSKQGHQEEKPSKTKVDNSAIAKQFEEIKVMFQDLPSRVEGRLAESLPRSRQKRRSRKFHPMMFDEFMHFSKYEDESLIGLLVMMSPFKDDMPWLYDICSEIYFASESEDYDRVKKLLNSLIGITKMAGRHPYFDELIDSKETHMILMDLPHILERYVMKNLGTPVRVRRRRKKAVEQDDEAND